MTTRYASALEEIRSLLGSRSQADPQLEAPDVWEELTCYPVPSLRTVRRLMEQIRNEGLGRRGQSSRAGQHGQTKPTYTRSNYRMTNSEIRRELDELRARADAYDGRSVEIGTDTVAVLEAAARREGTTRHTIAAFAMLKYVRERYPDLAPSDSPGLGARLN